MDNLPPSNRSDVFGYFDDQSDTPKHDPGMSAICPVCAAKLERPVVTISLMPDKIRTRSYFFRAHKKCWDECEDAEKSNIESSLIDAIHSQQNP